MADHMTTTRDPRTDPQPGDVLRIHTREEVIVSARIPHAGGPDMVRLQSRSRAYWYDTREWAEWCQTGEIEVIHLARTESESPASGAIAEAG